MAVHHLAYNKRRWRDRISKHQLKIEPMCRLCRAKGLIVPATVADHIEKHGGDQNKFWFGQLQSLCVECHNRAKQQIETRGYVDDIGPDGMPTDPKHPFNARR
jgi:hypothetical protein